MQPKISAFVCGRDQGLTLEVALRSLSEADELLYLDGGSADDSCEIAERCGARVIKPEAGTTGSGYRNLAASLCKHPYAIWLSPDDELEAGGMDKIREALKLEPTSVSLCISESKFKHQFWFRRVFNTKYKWVGRVHEYLDAPEGIGVEATIFHHRGPWHDKPTDPDEIINALMAEVADSPDNPRWYYFIGREYFVAKKYGLAAEWLKKRAYMDGFVPETADACLMLAEAYAMLDQLDEARQYCVMAVMINPNFKEAILFQAELAWDHHKAQWNRMAETADNSLVLCVRV